MEDSVSPPEGKAWWREASAVWINGWVTAMHDPAIARAREAEDRRWRELLTKIVEKGQADGAFKAEVDASAFVRTLFALLEGFLVQLVLEDPEVSESFAREQSMRFIADQLQFDPFEVSLLGEAGGAWEGLTSAPRWRRSTAASSARRCSRMLDEEVLAVGTFRTTGSGTKYAISKTQAGALAYGAAHLMGKAKAGGLPGSSCWP